jgi:tetratricopeptide (TPR) repeat protein
MTHNIQPGSGAGAKRLASLLLLVLPLSLFAGTETNQIFAQRAAAAFHQAQIQFQSNTNDPATAWQFARTCYDWADFATNDAGCAAIAREGIAASRALLARNANSAPGHYYLAMNFGQLAKAEAPSLAAYRLVHEMEREFKTAATLDGTFDYAGPARCLGLLYRDAPGWPFSIGSRRKARDWLEEAVRIAPDYPENRLNLLESHLRWREHAEARKDLKALNALWPKARTNFTGVAWEPSWADWTPRKNAAEEALAHASP